MASGPPRGRRPCGPPAPASLPGRVGGSGSPPGSVAKQRLARGGPARAAPPTGRRAGQQRRQRSVRAGPAGRPAVSIVPAPWRPPRCHRAIPARRPAGGSPSRGAQIPVPSTFMPPDEQFLQIPLELSTLANRRACSIRAMGRAGCNGFSLCEKPTGEKVPCTRQSPTP